ITGPRPTWSTATSTLPDRTSCGSPTSLMCRQWRGFSISPSCSTPGAARSSAGRWQTTCAPNWCWMRWRWLLANVGPRTSSTTAGQSQASVLFGEPFHGADRPLGSHRLHAAAPLGLFGELPVILEDVLAGERALEPVEELRGRIDLVVVLAVREHGHFVQV